MAQPSSDDRQIRSIQALRAIAALFVVAFHTTNLWHDKLDPNAPVWHQGNAGVDLFFVISGFIMVVSSRRLRDRLDGWRRFLELRIVRIVPMYWLTTAAKLGAITVLPAMAAHTAPTAWNTAASFLFLPAADGNGEIRPVLDVGWTLNFEMLFYAVFALALWVRKPPLFVVGPVMLVLAALHPFTGPGQPALTSFADPIVLEFVLGIAIATLFASGRKPPSSAAWIIVSLGALAFMALTPTENRWSRVTFWGVPAAITLACAVLAEPRIRHRIPGVLVLAGEASYALYLTHGFVLPVLGAIAVKAHLHGPLTGPILLAASLASSLILAVLVYKLVEVPLTNRLRAAVSDRGRTVLAAPETPV